MDVKEALQKRRAYRSLAPAEITPDLINDLASCAQLAPSCFNNQPWRYIFVYKPETLLAMQQVFRQGNQWCYADSLIVVVISKPDLDCQTKDGREYYMFDCGMATFALILRATELELVAHPISGFHPDKVREVLSIPEGWNVITLINMGKHSDSISPVLEDWQVYDENHRPPRFPLDQFVHHNRYEQGKSEAKPPH